jgi:hypothetical protein
MRTGDDLLSLVVETGDSVRDGAGESVRIGRGAVGEIMLLDVPPEQWTPGYADFRSACSGVM